MAMIWWDWSPMKSVVQAEAALKTSDGRAIPTYLTGVRATLLRPGPTMTQMGFDWDPVVTGQVIEEFLLERLPRIARQERRNVGVAELECGSGFRGSLPPGQRDGFVPGEVGLAQNDQSQVQAAELNGTRG